MQLVTFGNWVKMVGRVSPGSSAWEMSLFALRKPVGLQRRRWTWRPELWGRLREGAWLGMAGPGQIAPALASKLSVSFLNFSS